MDAPLTIACVYKPGGGFSNDYVDRLKISVKKFCKVPHEFVCLTTVPGQLPGIKTIPLINGWMGWWNKIELFRKDLFPGPIAYFDLDTMFVGDISDMVLHDEPFVCATNWKGPGTHISSAIMCWDGRRDFSCIYEKFRPSVMQQYEKSWEKWGDQGFVSDHLPVPFTSLNEKFPGRIVSYKWHVRRPGKVPPGASIVGFHGTPRPHQVNWTLPT